MSGAEEEADKRWKAAMAKLTQELTDQGLLIEAGWMGFRSMVLPRNVPIVQLDQQKTTFFAGALHLFSSIMGGDGIFEPGGEPTEADERRMRAIDDELHRFGEEFTRRYRSKMT